VNTNTRLVSERSITYGVKVAPAQFQACIDKILAGVPHTFTYIDDILIATADKTEHVKVLEEVFQRLEKFNVKLNRAKCVYMKPEVVFLGHVLSEQGISPVESKVEAIQQAQKPQDVSELKSFLGMINYYSRFVENLSSRLKPLYNLLGHENRWNWDQDCDEAFRCAKEAIASAEVLAHYDPTLPLVLSVDASPYGLGAVISHRMSDGSEKPIAFASRTLSSAERNYAQIEKEALAIIFGIKKFHLYLFGHKFTLITDHQPLTRIFGPKSGIPTLAASRMQRWALILSGYDYQIEYRSSKDNANADMLSRFPVGKPTDWDDESHYTYRTVLENVPVTADEIKQSTRRDPVLSKVFEYTLSGWPRFLPDQASNPMTPYFVRKHELSIEDDCILWGRRVIIPDDLQDRVLAELHECHPGITRMKALARSYVWWPGQTADIEDAVKSCADCTEMLNPEKNVPLLLWPWATEPWQRVHIDYLEMKGQMFIIFMDGFSKWMEVVPMSSTTAQATITVCRSLFARYGLPSRVVTDNGPQFIADDFKGFLKNNGIKHTLCPPYHPASNGQAEIGVQTFKRIFKKFKRDLPLRDKVSTVLFSYRNTPHSTTGKTPAELFLKRSPKTRLSLTKPSLRDKVEEKQEYSKRNHDSKHSPRARSYDVNQAVLVRNVRGGKEKWLRGTIVEIRGPYTYVIRMIGNTRRLVHVDQMRHDDSVREPNVPVEESVDKPATVAIPIFPPMAPNPPTPTEPITPTERNVRPSASVGNPVSTAERSPFAEPVDQTPKVVDQGNIAVRKSGRKVKPPDRLNLYVRD
jgi:hypothetical protein